MQPEAGNTGPSTAGLGRGIQMKVTRRPGSIVAVLDVLSREFVRRDDA